MLSPPATAFGWAVWTLPANAPHKKHKAAATQSNFDPFIGFFLPTSKKQERKKQFEGVPHELVLIIFFGHFVFCLQYALGKKKKKKRETQFDLPGGLII